MDILLAANFDKLVYDILREFSDRATTFLIADENGEREVRIHDLMMVSFRSLISYKNPTHTGLPSTEMAFSEWFIRKFTKLAESYGANGLDIVEMLEFMRREYEQVRASTIQ